MIPRSPFATPRRLAAAALVLFASLPAVTAGRSPAGRWEGAIDLPGQKLEVIVELSSDASGAWAGSIDIPLQKAENLPLSGVEFKPPKVRFEAPFEPMLPPIRFEKRPPARLTDPVFLAALLGEYVPDELPAQVAKVELAGTVLKLKLPGQPTYTLTPLRGTEFAIDRLEGYRVRFVVESSMPASEILFLQPEGVFSAKRKP